MRNVGRCTGHWCSKHWKMWWHYGVKDKQRRPAFIRKAE